MSQVSKAKQTEASAPAADKPIPASSDTVADTVVSALAATSLDTTPSASLSSSSLDAIRIRGAREHNLQNVSLTLPRNKLIVITGLSGSGKSSLAFDTIFAEGQRRYVESLSSYARMFLGRMHKPDVESIEGLSPAICIDQKSTSHNVRSTVGTVTEIYDYLRLLYARLGVCHCPDCGREIAAQTPAQVADSVLDEARDARSYVLAPVVIGKKGEFVKLISDLRKDGFTRARIDGVLLSLDDDIQLKKQVKHTIEVVCDRIVLRTSSRARIIEAIELASKLSQGLVNFLLVDRPRMQGDEALVAASESANGAAPAEPAPESGAPVPEPAAPAAKRTQKPTSDKVLQFSLAFACPVHRHSLLQPEPRDFSFNAPYGACPECDGIGSLRSVDPSLVVENPELSVDEGVFGSVFVRSNYYSQIIRAVCAYEHEESSTPWKDLRPETKKALLEGLGDTEIPVRYRTLDGRINEWTTSFEGVCKILFQKYEETQSRTTRQHLSRFIREVPCPVCKGARLKPEYLAVTVGGKNITEFCELAISDCLHFVKGLNFSPAQAPIAEPLIKEISARLEFMNNVGLDYLTLSRSANTLSGGEAQRIRLATQIGSKLSGVLYVLDEPSIGLHQRDNVRLIETLKRLRDQQNTVIVVEHDEDTIRAADVVVDMGPGAGNLGGHVVCALPPAELQKNPHSLTGLYLAHKKTITIPRARRACDKGWLVLRSASKNNLKHIDVSFPLGVFCVVTGVSGSGKSSLIGETLAPILLNRVQKTNKNCGPYQALEGLVDESGQASVDKVINIDQSPIGRTPRSNPATYIGLWDDLRVLFASLPESLAKGYYPGRFSFNVPGGRCEICKGEGQIKIEMNFLPDVYVECEACAGRRYNSETLSVLYRGKSIADVLDMTVAEALEFFSAIPKIKRKLQTLYDVGLGYVHLGQSAHTLSGGEAQRVKLARELHRQQTGKTFYILDEPTTGLHFEDVRMLIQVLQKLCDAGNTVLVVEHNLDVIKVADYVIDLGPEGGSAGGKLVCTGTPEEVSRCKKSYTGQFLKKMLRAR